MKNVVGIVTKTSPAPTPKPAIPNMVIKENIKLIDGNINPKILLLAFDKNTCNQTIPATNNNKTISIKAVFFIIITLFSFSYIH